MFNPLTLDAPYSETQFIDNLAVYATCKGTDEMLDLQRLVQESGNYYWQGSSFPIGSNTSVAPLTTVNGTIQLATGTIITAINYYADAPPGGGGPTDAGFKIKIYDKGSKSSIFYGDYALDRTVMSNMQQRYGVGTSNPPSDPGSNEDDPFGPNLLMNPFIITDPGVLGWEIVNLSANTQIIQVLVCCAIPITRLTISQKLIKKT